VDSGGRWCGLERPPIVLPVTVGSALRRGALAGGVIALSFIAGCADDDDEPSNAGIVWASDPGIQVVNVDGIDRRVVVPYQGASEGDPAWSPDGRALAYYSRESDTVEVHVLRPETSDRRVLTADWRSPAPPRRQVAYILEPSWSPDGAHLAVSDSWNLVAATIRIVSLSSRRWTSLTKPSLQRSDSDPEWSPDGRTIAFVRQRVRSDATVGRPVIFPIGRDGHGLRRLTRGGSPSWSPDGQTLVYLSGGTVYRVGADGRGRTPIVRGLEALEVRSSPDGRKLLYTTRVGDEGPTELWVMNHDGSDRVRIVRDAYMDGVNWQPG